ncbi:1725_t:CDS:2, partial [Cetraspora pellucida]
DEMENKNDIQEIFPMALLSDNVVEDSAERVSQQGLKSRLDRLSLEALKMLCKEEGLSEMEVKKELMERLAVRMFNKTKRKAIENSNISGMSSKKENIRRKRGEVRILEDNEGRTGVQEYGVPDLQYLALERSLEKTVQATMEKVPKEKLVKVRDQFEYDEWCRVGKNFDNVLRNKDWDLIVKARDVTATRAFMLRVANKERWNIVAGIRDLLEDDPIEAYFQERLANARELARNKRARLGSKPKMNAAFTGWLIGLGNVVSNQGMQWPSFQPVQSGFNSSMGPHYGNAGLDQGPYQRQYRAQEESWNRSWQNQGSPKSYNQEKYGRKMRNPGISGVQGEGYVDSTGLGISTMGAMQKPSIEVVGSKNRLEEVLLRRVNDLAGRHGKGLRCFADGWRSSMSSDGRYSKNIFGLTGNDRYDGTSAGIFGSNYERTQRKGFCKSGS